MSRLFSNFFLPFWQKIKGGNLCLYKIRKKKEVSRQCFADGTRRFSEFRIFFGKKIWKKDLTKGNNSCIIAFASLCNRRLAEYTEMYSRGRRGAPAKGVGRLSRRESSNLSISAKKQGRPRGLSCFYFFARIYAQNRHNFSIDFLADYDIIILPKKIFLFPAGYIITCGNSFLFTQKFPSFTYWLFKKMWYNTLKSLTKVLWRRVK